MSITEFIGGKSCNLVW